MHPSGSQLDLDLLLSAAAALIAGLIIGLERQIAIARDNKPSPDIGGVRTFPLIALVGALAAYLSSWVGAWLTGAVLLALVVLIAAHHLGKPEPERDPGLTTDAAAIATLLLGALAGSASVRSGPVTALTSDVVETRLLTPAAIAVVIALVLSVKERLHEITRRIGAADLFAILQLLVVAIVFLPLMPDRAYGPYDAINPAQVMKMIVFIGSIGLVGYLATALLGAGRALLVTGFIGGLVSSTAVTFSMARRAKDHPELTSSAALSIVAASSVMFVRVVVAAAVVFPALAPRLVASMAAMFVCGVAAA